MGKSFKGDKYIYYLMAYQLCKENNNLALIGEDNRLKGGQNYWRQFTLQEYQGKKILTEVKNSAGFADFRRSVEVIDNKSYTPTIKEYINEDGENCYKTWTH